MLNGGSFSLSQPFFKIHQNIMSQKEFKNRILTQYRDIKNNYAELLACLKFQNRIQQKQDQIKKRGYRSGEDSYQDQDQQYIFEHELSKENKIQVYLKRILEKLSLLSDVINEMREYAVVSLDASIQIPVAEEMLKMIMMLKIKGSN